MTTLMIRRALLDYARRPLNLMLLVLVPVVLVFVWSGSLVQFSKLLGGAANHVQAEAATAGWAAALLAGLAGFFQISGSRAVDRRLAAGAHHPAAVVRGRLGAGFGLALLAAAGGLVALAVRAGITDPARAVATTVIIAIIYLALGVLVGTLVRSEMNGALVVTLAWVFDVFFGPVLSGGSTTATRVFPLHFPTLVLTGQASGHSGPIGDVGWAIAWAIGLSALAVARLWVTTRPASRPAATDRVALTNSPAQAVPRATPPQALHAPARSTRTVEVRIETRSGRHPIRSGTRVAAGLKAGLRDYRRNRVLWVLLVAVPILFIVMAIMVTPNTPGRVALVDGARHFTALLSERRMHAATMVPITAAFLAGLTGLFVVTGSARTDRRLVVAGFRPREVLGARLGVIVSATVLTTAVAVAVSGAWYPPDQWLAFAAASLLISLTYAMVGMLLGPITGRLGGLYLILLLAFIDVGLGQTVMFSKDPPAWGAFLPARGASRMLIDAAFTTRFDQAGGLLLALAWLAALAAASTVVFHRQTNAHRRATQSSPLDQASFMNMRSTVSSG